MGALVFFGVLQYRNLTGMVTDSAHELLFLLWFCLHVICLHHPKIY